MGLAPYGEPKYRNLILSELMDLKDDGSFRLNMAYFNYCAGLTMTNTKFAELFGRAPRSPETEMTQMDMDIARSIQAVTEEIVLRMVRHVHKQTAMKNLCLAGGVGLNCVANGRILRESPFDDIWVQPAAGDAGGALGAALFTWHQYLGNKKTATGNGDLQKGSYLGPEFTPDYICDYLNREGVTYTELTDEELPEKIADRINDQQVVGWFQGRMEYGPRALGNRSIIGDARSAKMQETINLKIKYRESFRPFAPSVLKERAADYFQIDRESPYMLLVAPVKKEIRQQLSEKDNQRQGLEKLKAPRSSIPAVTHVDYSARVQTVDGKYNPRYYALIQEFDRKYGCGVIINTSFNVRGEPIVCTPEDAYRCFMATEMDCLVMGNLLIEKKGTVNG